ncbi:MAG TPA: OmpW family outer membrane protein [Steroidobacteraceae bacterium]|nr:OmpW family outer membrane protein [Steroidobacteraceae bacterium]
MRANKGIAAACALCAAAPVAYADSDTTPDNTVRVGVYEVLYHATADDISGPYTPSGLGVGVENLTTIYLGYVRRLSDHFAVELALGVPPVAATYARGPATVGSVPYDGQKIATARWLAPTALLEYQFLAPSSSWHPYIGFGVNYTTFYDRQVTGGGDQITGGPTKLSMTASVGPAGTVGINWNPWGGLDLNLSYSASMVNSTVSTDTAGIVRSTKVQFLPAPIVFSVGWRF